MVYRYGDAMKPKTATMIAGIVVGLVAAQSLGAFGGGSPTIISPVSMLLAVPAFLGLPLPIVATLFAGVFWLWCLHLFRGDPSVPKRTAVLLGITGALSILLFATGWRLGIQYQGLAHAAFWRARC